MKPLVTVICLCYNHERFLKEALDTVINQTYPNLEIIVADDFSTDNSRELLAEYAKQHPQIKYLPNEKNLGNCTTFNRAFALSHGEYIIDFATDDVLLPNRIEEQVSAFEKLSPEYGILFTDAELIDDEGKHLGNFYPRNPDGSLKQPVPSGYVFAEILKRHFISPPTLIMRRSLLEKMGGYDSNLTYEDFDLYVRASAVSKFFFLDKILTKRRLHPHQLSKKLYEPTGRHIFSTLKVCRKAMNLVKTEVERQALITRIEHEFTQAVLTNNKVAASELFKLLEEMKAVSAKTRFLKMLLNLPLPLAKFRKVYYQLKYGR